MKNLEKPELSAAFYATARTEAEMAKQKKIDTKDMTPLDYLLSVIRDPNTDPRRRDALAMFCVPYCHARMYNKFEGKGERKKDRAKKATLDSVWADQLKAA